VGQNRIVVSAMDIYENQAHREFTITRVAPKTTLQARRAEATEVHFYALVIGNNNYKHLKKLQTAKNDAIEVAETLKLRYGFNSHLLLDADRNGILDAINNFRSILKQNDLFLIYYAGHGNFDKVAGKAYWLPIDAQKDNEKKLDHCRYGHLKYKEGQDRIDRFDKECGGHRSRLFKEG
jgi:hypothetical protein